MTQQQQEEVNLLKELIADSSISAEERDIYEGALSELMKNEKPKASTERKRLINDIKPQKTTERKPRTTTQRKPQAPKQSKSDIESAKAEIKRRTGKTEEECESIVNEYRSLRAKSVERKKKETIASADNKDRVAKLKKDDKIISGTNEKTADAVIETTTKDVAEKIVKEIDKIEQKAEVEATKEVKKEMPKESATDQNKAIAEKTEEKVKEKTKTIVKRIVIDTSSLLSSIAESLGKFDKDSQKEFLIKLRSDIDKLLTKYSYGGSTMGATQGYNITQSNLSSSSVNPTMFNGGGGVGEWSVTDISNANYLGVIEFQDNEGEFHNFEIMETDDRLVFGGMTNTGFIESGYIEKDGFSTDEALQELISDLEVYYNDGGQYTSNIVFNQRMAKGGKVYNRSWHQDHNRFNKSENYEVPLSSRKKKRFDDGGGVGNGYMVFNYTDNLYASDNTFATKKEANNFIKEFRNRYRQQGYYRDSNMNKIDIEDIDLLVIEENFNPFRKFDDGGGVGSGLNYGKKDDVFIEVITLLNSKLEKPTFMGKQQNTKQVMSLDSFMEYIKKYEMDERYEVNVPIELFTKESFSQYNTDDSKLKFISGSISLVGKEDLLKKYIRNKESFLSKRLTYEEISKINERNQIKNAPEKTTIIKRIVSKQLLENGGGVEKKEDYFFDEDDYENN
jgi:hypothetical protein